METSSKIMKIQNNYATITKYEVMEAFFRTESENNIVMAEELNKILNIFYEMELQTRRNVTELPFDISLNKNVINYIKQSAFCTTK